MTTAPNKLAWFNRQSFPRHKEAQTFRVFCLGGSTTYGHPYDDTASFAAWLRELLPLSLPETRWEVINAGGISYASYRVASLMEELSQYKPDLFIVYSGHNEFLEERTYGELRAASPARVRLTAALAHTRTYALLDRVVHGSPPPAQLPSEVDAALDHSVGPSSYHRDDRQRQQVLQHFDFNLNRMVGLARAAGAGILFATPAANLKDCSPFKSEHGQGLSLQEQQRVSAHLDEARRLEREGDVSGALAECQAAVEIDPRFAESHFLAGRQLLALKRRVEAAAAFRRALDEDICPVRAPSEIRAIVRRAADRWGVPAVDFVALLERESLRNQGHTVPGNEYFLDHVHPTLEATRLLGVAIARELAGSGLIDSGANWSEEQIAKAARRIESRLDEQSHAVALRTLAKVLNWAGKHEQAGPLAVKALDTLPDDPESLVLAAAWLKSTGQAERAIEYYRRALRHAPAYVEAHRLLGAALVEQGEFAEALVHLDKLRKLTPHDAHAWHMCGAVLAELGRYEEAIQRYETALGLASDNAHLHYNLGLALARLDRRQEAIVHLRRALELNPADKEARLELEPLLAHAQAEPGP
jgi:tetratricopeptide (TPR) repeat protein